MRYRTCAQSIDSQHDTFAYCKKKGKKEEMCHTHIDTHTTKFGRWKLDI